MSVDWYALISGTEEIFTKPPVGSPFSVLKDEMGTGGWRVAGQFLSFSRWVWEGCLVITGRGHQLCWLDFGLSSNKHTQTVTPLYLALL